MRAEHIEDILVTLHEGQWFCWTNSKNKVYANLRLTEKMGVEGELVDNPHSLPTEKSLTDALTKAQTDFDAQDYARNRELEYPSTGDQLDMMYKDNKNSTTTHADAVEAVKTKWPKDNSGPVE
ncbi:uncharacterized protein METZ01_LOCUS282751 [marine metagenome]|uniref:Uncharacterized protein n=1 Tax=marine metagenome TaxID=408172 RepID=A0A382L4I6_9ZZZZ